MTNARSPSLPVAIVAGSTIIGVSLYLGLRAMQPAAQPTQALPSAPPAAGPPTMTGAPAPSASITGPTNAASTTPTVEQAPARPTGAALEALVQQQAQAALDALAPTLGSACWTPPGPDEPASVVLDYDVTFDPDGTLVMLGIGERRDAFRTDVASCLRGLPRPQLAIDPPGEHTRVVLALALP
ncbi:hypothetical protein [Paraliomyxa miuraensis]|uniref:hypothetical protein n=1 Tax=Paraliomyxa miuraensis TaxID=376150 RepID=UPI00224CABE5|nr:hypothetical protein [Paraliomyxa miuraensis]MCX4239506.1 hypothetical protein [Paraliomyxa miuraensis]